jgi:hypothetical protein
MGTAYPGARVSTGGEAGWYVFAWVTNLFSPWSETANACEGAMFLGFFPVTEILAVAWLVSRRGRGMLMWLLVAVDALLITFSVAGLPAPLAQLLLLTPVSSNRAWLVVTLVEVFIYMHMLSSAGSREPDADAALARPAAKGTLGLLRARAVRIVAAVAALAALAVFLFNARASLPEFAVPFGFGLRSLALVGALAAVFAGLVLMAGHAKARGVAAAMLIALSLAAGATVNPLARTLDAITAKPLYAKVRAIEESSPGRWLATGSVGAEYLIAAGAATVNSTNILPALERWSVFDPGAAQDVYNRYAHINVSLTDGENRILPGASNDSFNVEVNGNGLSLLGVDYLCVFDGAPVPAAMLDCLEKIYDEHGVAIYLVASRPDMRRSS